MSTETAANVEVAIHGRDPVFQFHSLTHYRYSDNALRKMQDALDGGLDMGVVWKEQGLAIAPGRRT